LFEDEELANILAQVVKNERPKSDLEKTKWWDFIKLQSFKDKNICDFIQNDWVTLNPKFILDTLHRVGFIGYKENILRNLPSCLKETLIDNELIKTIEREQKEIDLRHFVFGKVIGPKLKPIKVKTKTGEENCVAINHNLQGKIIVHTDTCSFLTSLGLNWIESLKNASRDIDCDHQHFPELSDKKNEERDSILAEVIFLNYPETFNICEKEYYLYICGWNWNFTKGEEHASD
jgi:hypothetical protein